MKTLLRPILLVGFSIGLLACSFSGKQDRYENQAKINALVQTGMHYYWNGGDLKTIEDEFFKGITLKGKYDVVENAFTEASLLAPSRLDLRFSIASTQITRGNIKQGLESYHNILNLYPQSFQAASLNLAYTQILEDNKATTKALDHLKRHHPERSGETIKTLDRLQAIYKLPIQTQVATMNTDYSQAIVILGYALDNNGEMKQPLIERLKQGLAAAQHNRSSAIIVSGGVPKNGLTEAYLMKQWLVKKGIHPARIYVDDLAKDTVGNAFYSTQILKTLGSREVMLITSASHIRRALAIFIETGKRAGLNFRYQTLVYLDYPSVEEAQVISKNERLVITRDIMRSAGFWAYPTIQR